MYPLPIFIVGFTGVGKTTFGKAYAERHQLPFIDFDEFIEQQEGMTIADIFQKKGEDYFREIEYIYLKQLPQDVVIATGGGTPCYYDNMDWMLKNGTVLYLKDSSENIVKKLMKTDLKNRPLLASFKKTTLLVWVDKNLAERLAFYERAHYSIDVSEDFDTSLK